jgi:U3 small nucleolar RNA-associated protein 14
MSPNESVNDMFSRFTLTVNSLKYLGKHFSEKQILIKFLRSLSPEWTSFVTFIKEEKDPNCFSIKELMELAYVHEMTMLSHKQSNPEFSNHSSKVVLLYPESEPYNAESSCSSYESESESESDLSISSSSDDDPDE